MMDGLPIIVLYFSLVIKKCNRKTQQQINISIYNACGSVVFTLLYYVLLVLMRALVEDEGDSSIPGSFQHLVPQSLLVEAVVPLGKVTGTVRVICRRPNLPAIHAAATAKPNSTTRGRKRGWFSTLHRLWSCIIMYDKMKTTGGQMYKRRLRTKIMHKMVFIQECLANMCSENVHFTLAYTCFSRASCGRCDKVEV